MVLTVATCLSATGATPPTISSGDQVTWYLLRFLNRNNVLEAKADGAEVLTASAMASDAQLWKIEGNEAEGYTLTSKNGMKLYTTTTQKEGMFHAAKAPTSSNTRFVWSANTNTTYPEGWNLSPKANAQVYMNQWQGAGLGKRLGLWDNASDAGNAFQFVSLEEWESKLPKYALIPYPKMLKEGKGEVSVNSLTHFIACDDITLRYGKEFAAQLKATMGHELTYTNQSATQAAITLAQDEKLAHEAYTLTIKEGEGVKITAADSTGFFYALQTLKQLLPNAIYGKQLVKEAKWVLPCLEIKDQPQLGHRGFMLDVARHFFDKREVKRILDIMASYKMNRFHWHLTDDQGWRIEIPEYPLLTEVGSIRKGSFACFDGPNKFFDDTEYGRGMWYSLDDLREIVAYAKARHIEIIPEIDLPGHMVAAVASYPQFSCDSTRKYEVRIDGGISHDVLNIGRDETVDFLKCVLRHVAEVFPYPQIHIGGDECPTEQWATNADCLKRVKDEGLKGVEELQSWLVEELGLYLKKEFGKDIVVWDELLKHWKADNKVKPIIMAWNSIGHSAQAADKGFKSIVVPYQDLYIDWMQIPENQADINEGYQGGWGPGHVNTVEDAYNINPVGALKGRENYCLGVQANMWTETCSNNEQLEYQLFPRLLAVSETGWLPAESKDWTSFYKRLQSHDEILELLEFNYAKHYILPEEKTAGQLAIEEAKALLAASIPGGVGYPSAEAYKQLETAVNEGEKITEDAAQTEQINKAIAAYKKAPIVQPEAGKTYQLVSASSYYKAKYIGSTVYAADSKLRFHYTPQTEPEELWQFVKTEGGYKLVNVSTKLQVTMPTNNGGFVQLGQTGTTLRIDQATKPSGKYNYVPGAVVISATNNYASAPVRFFADFTGYIKTNADDALCKAGTWYIREVTDFTSQLEGLVKKGQKVITTAAPGEYGQPTQEALDFLANQVLTPASAALKQGNITEEVYIKYLDLYNQFLAMPRTSVTDGISEAYYYVIRNAHFKEYCATISTNESIAPRKLTTGDEKFYWSFKKNADGTVNITNKNNGKQALVNESKESVNVLTGASYKWKLEEITTDEGNKGIAIIDATDTYSWYTNPNSWKENIILKPKNWGASIWIFEKLDVQTAIEGTEVVPAEREVRYYDLQGRRVLRPTHGIYITSDGRKVMM